MHPQKDSFYVSTKYANLKHILMITLCLLKHFDTLFIKVTSCY